MSTPDGTVDPALLDRVRDRAGPTSRGRSPPAGSPPPSAGRSRPRRRRAARRRRRPAGRAVGAGPLEPLLADPEVTDVLVNGPTGVWVDRGSGLERVRRRPRRRRRRCAGSRSGSRPRPGGGSTTRRRGSTPRLPDGTRLHAVLPPVVGRAGTHLSPAGAAPARAHARRAGRGAAPCPPAWAPAAAATVVRARLAFLVTGGTGAGKTTLLAALLGLVPAGERIVVVEDSRRARAAATRTSSGSRPGRPTSRARARSTMTRPGAPGAADAAGPAGRRRGARRRGARAAGRAEHRPRGRLRHRARQPRRPTCRPGWRRWARWPAWTGRPCTPRPGRRSTSSSTCAARVGAPASCEVAAVRGRPGGSVQVGAGAGRRPPGRLGPGSGWPALAERLGLGDDRILAGQSDFVRAHGPVGRR